MGLFAVFEVGVDSLTHGQTLHGVIRLAGRGGQCFEGDVAFVVACQWGWVNAGVQE